MPSPITRLDIPRLIKCLEFAERSFQRIASLGDGLSEEGQDSIREGRKELSAALKQLRHAQMTGAM